ESGFKDGLATVELRTPHDDIVLPLAKKFGSRLFQPAGRTRHPGYPVRLPDMPGSVPRHRAELAGQASGYQPCTHVTSRHASRQHRPNNDERVLVWIAGQAACGAPVFAHAWRALAFCSAFL